MLICHYSLAFVAWKNRETESLEQTFDRRQQKSSGVINDLVKAGVTPAQGSAGWDAQTSSCSWGAFKGI